MPPPRPWNPATIAAPPTPLRPDPATRVPGGVITSERLGSFDAVRFHYIDTWIKKDGRWQCVASQATFTAEHQKKGQALAKKK